MAPQLFVDVGLATERLSKNGFGWLGSGYRWGNEVRRFVARTEGLGSLCAESAATSRRTPARLSDPVRLGAMLHAIRHRGPDDAGTHLDDAVALGQARLSIIDLAGGHQPIYNEDGTKCIILNGEIYNYLDLRQRLVARGHVFTTKSDTEVVLHLYEDEGEDCVNLRSTGCSRSPSGTLRAGRCFSPGTAWARNRSTTRTPGAFFGFASEIKALMAAGLLDGALRPDAVDEFLALNYTIGPQTALADVRKLMPGHRMTVPPRARRVSQDRDFADVEPTNAPFEECYERMVAAIDDSVRVRLMSEVPLGAYLSGGVDSSLVVAVMTKLTQRPVQDVHGRLRGRPGRQRAGVRPDRREARRRRAPRVRAEAGDLRGHRRGRRLAHGRTRRRVRDDPLLLLLSRLAKKHVTVMLSGEGADEIFAGYPIYRYMALVERYRSLPAWLRKSVGNPILRRCSDIARKASTRHGPSSGSRSATGATGSCFTDTMRAKLLTPGLRRDPGRRAPADARSTATTGACRARTRCGECSTSTPRPGCLRISWSRRTR